ncbi:MAG: hypothetical protein RL076_1874 [Chloroflexota bacterium]
MGENGYGVRVRECVQVGNLVRDGVLVRLLDGVNVRGLVSDGVRLRVGVLERVIEGVKLSVGTRVSDGVWVITGVDVGVREVITPYRLLPAT